MLSGEARRPTYRVLEQLRSGPYSDAFVVWHEVLEKKMVQKTVAMGGLEDALAAHEPGFLEQLSHPRIVRVREAQFEPTVENAITFVMPYYEGGSVADALLMNYRFSVGQAVSLALDGLSALSYLHRKFEAIHRDVKPGNLFLNRELTVAFLGDFGSAATLGSEKDAPAVLGTTLYLAPEAGLTKKVGHASDCYALALTLYEMLNGRLPWERMNPEQMRMRVNDGRRAPTDSQLSQYSPAVPPALRRAVNRGLAKRPEDRFACAEDFQRELRSAMKQCIDWRLVEESEEGIAWQGVLPAHRADRSGLTIRLTRRKLASGPNKGAFRMEAKYLKNGMLGWRQLLPAVTPKPTESAAETQFFRDVESAAFQKAAAS